MTEVRILPKIIANKIAAGEVVERPASVVKELVENSLDAGAKRITIEIEKGGGDLIRISDDGYGMSRKDALLSIQRHATSKIVNDDDLFSIKTFGFRGEALPSIGSVSNFSLTTRDAQSDSGTKITISGGKLIDVSETGAPIGTMIEVKNLYFNTPARRKFLKTVNTEMGHIADSVSAFALAFPDVHFSLIHNGRNVKHFSESDDLLSRVGMVLKTDSLSDLYTINSDKNRELSHEKYLISKGLYLTGYITKPSVTRNSSNNILLFVNKRIISDRALISAILKGYKGRLIKGQFPMAVLFINIPFDQVDVNVHPAKLQVRFANQSLVFGAVVNAVHNALYHGEKYEQNDDLIRTTTSPHKNGYTAQRDISQIHETFFEPLESKYSESKYINNSKIADFHGVMLSEPTQEELPYSDYAIDHTKGNEIQLRDFHIKKHTEVEDYTKQNQNSPKTNSQYVEPHQASDKIKNITIIGQFANTYIIAESKEGLVLIDQHAAHERVVYERLKKRSQGFKPPSQDLIVPEIIEFNYKEAASLEKIIPELLNVGIDIEHFGGTTFVIKSVPAIIDDRSIKQILRDIVGVLLVERLEDKVDELLDDKDETTTIWLDKLLTVMACHSAIRANHQLNRKEMEQLIADLQKCENPYHCPHGRPTIISFSEKELEKRFKRIV